MRSVRLAGGLEISPLGVGAWAWGDRLFWGYDDSQEDGAQQAFNTAVDLGVNLFDTAEVVYGAGADPNILTSQCPILNPLYIHYILTLRMWRPLGLRRRRRPQQLGLQVPKFSKVSIYDFTEEIQ